MEVHNIVQEAGIKIIPKKKKYIEVKGLSEEALQIAEKGGMIWENSTETCILTYVKQITSPGSMHEAECSGLVHWDDPERWDREGGGREGQDGEHVYTHGWFMWTYGKNHHSIVK